MSHLGSDYTQGKLVWDFMDKLEKKIMRGISEERVEFAIWRINLK